jgi:Flp pilus assembly pilin Flp
MEPVPHRRRGSTRRRSQAGQGLVEYVLIFVLIVVVAIASLTFFGTAVTDYLSTVGTSV